MKINSLLESQTPSSNTTNTVEQLEETTTSGSVATVASPVGGMQRRGKGSMFAGIKTSEKYPNSEAVKEGLPKEPKDEFKRQALLVKDRKTGKLYDPNVEFDKKMNSPEVKAQMKRMAMKEGFDDDNFTADDINRLATVRDLQTIKAQAKELIKGKPMRRMKPEKIAYFYDKVDSLTSPMKVVKLMYDLLLAGEGLKTVGSSNSMDSNAYQKRFTETEQLEEVDPRNFDSDEDYYRARNAPARQRSAPSSYPYSQQDDDAYFREIFRKKRLAKQQAEREADHDRLATGTNEELEPQHGDIKPWAYWGFPERVAKKLYQIHRGEPIDKSAIVQLWKQDGPDRMTKFMLKPDVASILSAYEQMSDEGLLFKQGVAEGYSDMMAKERRKRLADAEKKKQERLAAEKAKKDKKQQGVAENFDAQAAASKEAEIGRLKAQLKNPNNSFDDHYKITRQIQKLIGMHTDASVLGKDVAEESTAPTKYRATVEYGPTAADAHFVTVTASSTEEAEAKVQKWCEKKGVRNPMITINGADKPVDVAEDKLANDLYRDLQIFKKGADKDIGSKAKDKDIVAKEESKGLWANIHAKQNRIKNGSGERMRKPGSKGAPTSQNFKDASVKNESNGEYDDEAGSAESNLLTMSRAVKGLIDTIDDRDNLPEWVQEKIAKAEQMLVTSWDYLLSQKEQGHDPQVDEDWQKTNKQDKTDGMSPKAVKAYRRENPGSKLKTAVTKKPSELKAGSKDANRRKSFCARMSGNKGPMKDEKGRPTPKAKALRRWNCE